MAINPHDASEAEKARKLLEPTGTSLLDAVRFYVSHRETMDASETLGEAFAAFVAMKGIQGRSETYLADIRAVEKRISAFIGMMVASIDLDAAEKILAVYGGPTKRDGARRILRAVVSESIRRGKAKENGFAKAKVLMDRATEPQIVTIKQLIRLLRSVESNKHAAAAIACEAFAGIRPQEVERLCWENIRLNEGIIVLDGSSTKTNRRRVIPLEPVLKAWLVRVPENERDGPIIPADWKRIRRGARQTAGIGHMQDVLRHSYASAWLAINPNVNELRAAMGHASDAVLFRHYRALMMKRDAIAYFRIAPRGIKIQPAEVAA